MENNLEQLLNSLIEKGWKPFGITCIDFIKGTGLECIPSYCFNPHPHMWFPWWTRKYHRPSLRQIVSKESWLWQFVCENKLITNSIKMREAREHDIDDYSNILIMYDPYEYQYRLIESALKDESELEDFLLSNIVITDEKSWTN